MSNKIIDQFNTLPESERNEYFDLFDEYLSSVEINLNDLAEKINNSHLSLRMNRKSIAKLLTDLNYPKKDLQLINEKRIKEARKAIISKSNENFNDFMKSVLDDTTKEEIVELYENGSLQTLKDKYNITQHYAEKMIKYCGGEVRKPLYSYHDLISDLNQKGYDKDKISELYLDRETTIDSFIKKMSNIVGKKLTYKHCIHMIKHLGITQSSEAIAYKQGRKSRQEFEETMAKLKKAGFSSREEVVFQIHENKEAGSKKTKEDFIEFVSGLYQKDDRKKAEDTLHDLHLDAYFPDKQIAVVFKELPGEDEGNRRKNYEQWKQCQEQGIQLISIWEDSYYKNPDLIENMIKYKLHLSTSSKVFARNTEIRQVDFEHAKQFYARNHIQGFAAGYHYGLFIKDTDNIVALSTWSKNNKDKVIYLDRYATSTGVVGGFSKVLKYAKRQFKKEGFSKIITFAAHDVSNGSLYEKQGFVLDKELPPDYWYFYNNERKHKFGFRLKRFKNDPELYYSQGLTESELAKANGIPRVWDCGKSRYSLII